jgi:3-oxoacyl-[acyl-carrier protein] reductase
MEIDLSNKVALVTGAAGALGRVMAQTLASCGAAVAVHYHTKESDAKAVVEKIIASGGRAIPVQADITKEDSVAAMKAIIVKELGDPDIVVNNAVSGYPWKTILEQDLADFRSQWETVIIQSVLTAKAFLPAMQKKKEGRFIGINTESSYLCEAGTGVYAANKRGLSGLYRVLAKEVGPDNITVNQVAPGWTITYHEKEKPVDVGDYCKSVPLRRRGTDEELAKVIAFLASDLASFITGVCLPVDGGKVMV